MKNRLVSGYEAKARVGLWEKQKEVRIEKKKNKKENKNISGKKKEF